jgi:hypothetical protein
MSERRKFLVIFGLAVCAWVPFSAAILFWMSDLTFADVSNTLMEMLLLY